MPPQNKEMPLLQAPVSWVFNTITGGRRTKSSSYRGFLPAHPLLAGNLILRQGQCHGHESDGYEDSLISCSLVQAGYHAIIIGE